MRTMTIKIDPGNHRRTKKSWLLTLALLMLGIQAAHSQAVSCPPNIDFSFGNLNNWYCWTGISSTPPPPPPPPFVPPPPSVIFTSPTYTGPISGRHDITSGTGTDPYGGFSVTAPGGGLFSLKLGNRDIGAEAERVQYYVHVPVGFNNYSFSFKYAVVLEDIGHDPDTQPAFIVRAYDSATNQDIPCATLTYVAGAGLPGFFQSTAPIVTTQPTWYLPWTSGTLNLSGQGGKTIIVEATSYDCSATGHFGYGYFDVISCGQFNAAITYCNLSAGYATLTAPAGYKTYKWFKGPVITGAPISTSQSFNAPVGGPCAFYYCVLDPYNSNGCPDTIRTRNICDFSVNATPDTVCNSLGNPIQLNVTQSGGIGGVYTYQWMNSPTLSTPRNIPNPIASPTGSGFYVVTVADSIGCFRQDTVIIQNPNFKLNLGPDLTTCVGSPITLKPGLTPSSPGYVFKWTNYGSTTAPSKLDNNTILNPKFTPTAVPSVTEHIWDTLVLRVDSGVCATADTFRIRTLPNDFNITDTAVCKMDVFKPNVLGHAAFNYQWNPNNTTLSFVGSPNGMLPSVTADTTRTFFVTAKYPTCPDVTKQITFRVEPLPNVELGADTFQKCLYTPLYLTAKVTPSWFTEYSYKWEHNQYLDALTNPIITFTGPSDTTLIVTVTTPLGCKGVDSAVVSVYQGHFGTVSPDDTAVCPRNPVKMTATGGVSYLWQPATYLSDSHGSTVIANPQTSIDYTLYVTDKNGCVDTLPVSLQVYSEAMVSVPDSAVLYPGQSYQLDPGGNGHYFSWFPVIGLSNPNIANPVANPLVNTRYFVTARTEAGCIATDSIYMMVHEESAIDMPNAFTPGAASNARFGVARIGIASLKSFRIYNRWGTKVFETSDINKGWDGTFNGEAQPIGVYMYTVEAVNNKGRILNKKGNVTLLR